MSVISAAAPDLEAIKTRQQETWASGDYAAVGATIPIISEWLCDSADLRAGWRVLDVAGGSGNTALAAARCGCEVVSIDYVPSLLARASERARAEGLAVEVIEGDAEALPFPDASFDAVVSVVGVMFAPDHERAAAELARVCRPGGTIAVANWTPDGFIGELFATTGTHVPPPAGLRPPPLWGTEEHVRALLGDRVQDLRATRRSYTFRQRSPERFVEFFRQHYGPTLKAFAALDADGRRALAEDIAALVRRFDRLGGDGPVACPADYLEVVATRA
jgi:ubiquinone/menaquinone biosynthesis C-methylase UbiE